nr:MAG TPA: hypothetical protein [Bacteriophage sp.]
MIKEYRDILFESGSVNKLNKDIKSNPGVNFKIVGYNVIPKEFGPDCTYILVDWEKEILEDSATKVSTIPESEVNTDTDPQVSEFISKRFNFPDDN